MHGTIDCGKMWVHNLIFKISSLSFFIIIAFDDNTTSDDGSPPQFSVELRNTEVIENTFLTFMVKVKGEPKPKVKL